MARLIAGPFGRHAQIAARTSNPMVWRSARTAPATPGYCNVTATRRPSARRAGRLHQPPGRALQVTLPVAHLYVPPSLYGPEATACQVPVAPRLRTAPAMTIA